MKVSLSIVMASHLSDAQEEMSMGMFPKATQRLNFVKYLIHTYDTMRVRIDADKVYAEFVAKHPKWEICSTPKTPGTTD